MIQGSKRGIFRYDLSEEGRADALSDRNPSAVQPNAGDPRSGEARSGHL